MQLVGQKPPTRRAVFVCEHPDLGFVVIDREQFRRRFRGYADECSHKSDIFARAERLLRETFSHNFEHIMRCRMFRVRGLTEKQLECTVVYFKSSDLSVYRRLPEHRYQRITAHPLAAQIYNSLTPEFGLRLPQREESDEHERKSA